MKRNRVELIGLIMSLILSVVLAVLFAGCICQLLDTKSAALIELDHLAERKAYCDSIGGHYGADKCYVNGEEMPSGGEE